MEKSIVNAKDLMRYDSENDYHDLVDSFDLSYKITLPSEQLNPLIHYHECFELIFYISADIEAYIDR